MCKALDECGAERGDEGIGFREVIGHTGDIVAVEVSRCPVEGPGVSVFHAI